MQTSCSHCIDLRHATDAAALPTQPLQLAAAEAAPAVDWTSIDSRWGLDLHLGADVEGAQSVRAGAAGIRQRAHERDLVRKVLLWQRNGGLLYVLPWTAGDHTERTHNIGCRGPPDCQIRGAFGTLRCRPVQ
jgi:hypothetical protein